MIVVEFGRFSCTGGRVISSGLSHNFDADFSLHGLIAMTAEVPDWMGVVVFVFAFCNPPLPPSPDPCTQWFSV